MALMVNKLIRYLKLYRHLVKFSAMLETEYRFSFGLEILVEIAFFSATLASMVVMFENVTEVAGWNRYEMMILYGFNMIFSEMLLGMVFINGLRELPFKIAKGELDTILIKPINSLFAVSLWRPYFASIPSAFAGLLVAIMGFSRGDIPFQLVNLLPFFFLYACGFITAFSIGVIISCLSFWFINAEPLPFLAQQFIFLAKHPYDIYSGVWRVIFFMVIPTAFMVSFPVQSLLGEFNWWWLAAGISLAVTFLFISRFMWHQGLKIYDSASS